MRFFSICVLCIFFLFVGHSYGGDIKRIELTDGSVILGEVLSSKGGVYTIRSETLGTIKIDESRIRVIHFKNSNERKEGKGLSDEMASRMQLQQLRKSMTANPEIMNMILSLQNNPDFQAVLKDKAIMEAVNAGDIQALLSNPKFMKLLNSPVVQDIGRKVGQ